MAHTELSPPQRLPSAQPPMHRSALQIPYLSRYQRLKSSHYPIQPPQDLPMQHPVAHYSRPAKTPRLSHSSTPTHPFSLPQTPAPRDPPPSAASLPTSSPSRGTSPTSDAPSDPTLRRPILQPMPLAKNATTDAPGVAPYTRRKTHVGGGRQHGSGIRSTHVLRGLFMKVRRPFPVYPLAVGSGPY
jgi:hypothetical protein